MTLGRPGALLAARYRLDRLMGSTGSAERWQAYDERLARPVTARLSPAAGEAAFEDGAQAALERLAGLNHPGVAAVYDVGTTDELGEGGGGAAGADSAAAADSGAGEGEASGAGAVSYAISEWTAGRTLGQIMATGPQPWARVADWGRQISGALAALHSLGIVHGALGPNSVAIHDDRQVKILDPGLGSVGEDEAGLGETAEPAESVEPAGVAGSDGESGEFGESREAEESAAGAASAGESGGVPVGAAGDVYALGLLLWEAGVGAGAEAVESEAVGGGGARDVGASELEWVREAGAPAELTALLAEMLDGDPARRPTADAAERRFVPFAATDRIGDTLPEMPAATTQGSMARRATSETHAIVPTPEVGLARPTAVTQRVGAPAGAAAGAAAARAAAEREQEQRRRRGMLIGLVLLLAAIGAGVGLLVANLNSSNAANPGVGNTAVPSVSPGTVTLPSGSPSPSPSQAPTSAPPPSSHAPSRSPSPSAGSSSPSASLSASPSLTPTPTDSASASVTTSSSGQPPSAPAGSGSPHASISASPPQG